ncbi:porin [Paraburkholderia pallida]|uniref:Porin n=1 Tax=Paraburkholderia pallida TaxID=2547399 RepID=A0A4P7CUQ2_9BURK|nr:porin [Paraburkholderia pallida]QBQ99840.1 porin [Paraburkholderia pallida]
MARKQYKRIGIVPGVVAAIAVGSIQNADSQSSVTLYGLLDGGLLYTSKTLDSATGQNLGHQYSFTDSGIGPSNFGLNGIEDLGGGLKAELRLESGINVGNGGYNSSNGNFFGRQAYAGLSGGFGEIKAGLQFSPFFLQLYELDPRELSETGSSLVVYVDNLFATGIFTPDAVSYTSPTFYGFQGTALLSLGGVAGEFQNGRQYSASLKYDNGTLMVGASYFNANASTGTALATPVPTQLPVDVSGRQIGASYKIGAITGKASFVNYKVGVVSNNVYGGGLDYLVLPQVDLNGGLWYEAQRHTAANHSLLAALGLNYALSRTSLVYAQVAVVNNHGDMDTGLSTTEALSAPVGTTTGVAVGFRHIF